MKWNNLVSLALFSYLISLSVHAQPMEDPAASANPQQQAVAPAPDNMTIEDTGGSLKIVPKGQQSTSTPQGPSNQMMATPPQGPAGQSPQDSVNMNPSPPQGELQEPSNSNQVMVPANPQQDSMPQPAQGSIQN